MNAYPFRHGYDTAAIEHWLSERNLSKTLVEALPQTGFIIFDLDQPIAAGFLRKIENYDYALIDSYITNPSATSRARHAALDQLTVLLVRKAKEMGLKGLMANTIEETIVARALRHGFQKSSDQLIGLSWEDK